MSSLFSPLYFTPLLPLDEQSPPASQVISQEVIQVVLHLDKRPKAMLTAKDLWHTIARFGGYLDRKSDPPPGWQTLWKGWIRVMTVLEGVHLARQFSP